MKEYKPFPGTPTLEERQKRVAQYNARVRRQAKLIAALDSLANEEKLDWQSCLRRQRLVKCFLKDTEGVGGRSNETIRFAVENMLSGDYIFKDVEIVRQLVKSIREWVQFRDAQSLSGLTVVNL
jgi:hypothetical protein